MTGKAVDAVTAEDWKSPASSKPGAISEGDASAMIELLVTGLPAGAFMSSVTAL
jgi:hypothetical protein